MTRNLLLALFFAAAAATASAQTEPSAAQRGGPGASGLAVTAPDAAQGRAGASAALQGTRASAFATIQGNALDSRNGVLPDAQVRLRNARSGRIVSAQITDKSGLFQFRGVDPGTYVVELVARDTVLAASQLISVNANDAVSAVVKLPFEPQPLGGLLGHSISQAAAITSAAAAVGVLSAATTTDVSADGTN